MHYPSFTLLLGLATIILATTTARADDPVPAASGGAYQSFANAAEVIKASGIHNTPSGPELVLVNGDGSTKPAAARCSFYITNKCKSKKRVYFSTGSKGSWGQLTLGTFYMNFGEYSGKLTIDNTAYLRFTRNIKFPNAGTAKFCTHPQNLGFTYFYSAKYDSWGSFKPGTTTLRKVGDTCGSIGGKYVDGYQRLKKCGQKIVLTKC